MNIINEYIEINGERQSLLTMRTDVNNPVLLIIHGGAGLPDRPLVQHCSKALADCYTVVCWDQRGCGFSYTKGPLSIELLLGDLKAVVEYLQKTYRKDKIYIAGHSWGSYLGLRFAAMYPEYVQYYIGTGQHISCIQDEIDRYRFVCEQARQHNDAGVLKKLDHFGAPDGYHYATDDKKAKLYVAATVLKYAGYFSRKNGISIGKYARSAIKLYTQCYGAKLPEVLLGAERSYKILNTELEQRDDISCITELQVPVLLISGEEDMICPVPAAQRWFNNLQAPQKEFVKVKNASHMVNFEQAQEWNRLLKELRKKRGE